MNFDFDPIQRKLVNGPEAGANVEVDGFTVSVIGGGTGTETLYNAGTGIGIEGSTITNTMAGSGRIAINGGTAAFNPEADIVNVTGTSVTLQPDTAYKMYATTGALNVTANPPAANKWAYEGHAEIFVGSVGYVVFDTSKIVLANQLEPDSVNNCTLRFHDGMCYVSVEDHIAGYIVVSATGTTAGTLPYGITSASQEYVAFDASLNGATIDLSGSTASAEKHVVGNGYAETTLTGAVDCGTSKFTVANLGLNNVQVTGGVMTFGDAYIPSGSTVNGKIRVENAVLDGTIQTTSDLVFANNGKMSGGGIIDLGTTSQSIIPVWGGSYSITGVTVMNGEYPAGALTGAIEANGGGYVKLKEVTTQNNTGGYTPNITAKAMIELENCNISGKSCVWRGGTMVLIGGNTVSYIAVHNNNESTIVDSTPKIEFRGSNLITSKVEPVFGANVGLVTISSGAILDLTGNTNATPIAPGGGITFGANVTVVNSAGTSILLNNGSAGTCNGINKDGTLVE